MKLFLIIIPQLVTFSFCCRKHDLTLSVHAIMFESYDDYEYEDNLLHPPTYTTTTMKSPPERIYRRLITCSYLYSLDKMSLNYSYQDEYFEQQLIIQHSHIPTIQPSVFSNFTTITKLSLTHLGIRNILPGAFDGLTKLENLNLSHNELSELTNGVFNSLNELEILNLNDNKIHKLENMAFHGTDDLVGLYFQRNKIKEIGDWFFEITKRLGYLDLSGNPLQDFTNVKNSSFEFMYLNLSDSQITHVDFENFPHSGNFDLSNNEIMILENCQVLNGFHLLAVNNSIRKITGSFSNVQIINLSFNEIQILNQSLFNQSSKITEIDLSFNKISAIENHAFTGLISLDELLLQNNRITKIDKTIFTGLTNLIILDLSQNSIEKFQNGTFDSLANLRVLNVANNRLLDLHQNTLNPLHKLNYLNFQNNYISKLNIMDLKNHSPFLRHVSLNGNLWKCQQIVEIINTCTEIHVSIKPGKSYGVKNINGISCENEKINNSNNISQGKNMEHFSKILENHTTKKMKFVNNHSIFDTIVLIFTVLVLLCGFYFFYNFLKRSKQRPSLSDTEL